jgi:phosphate transport system protein
MDTRPLPVSIDELERRDDRVDVLEQQLLAWAVNPERGDVQSSVDIALLARFYERYADQGVAAARRFFFITTGERSRASDAHT